MQLFLRFTAHCRTPNSRRSCDVPHSECLSFGSFCVFGAGMGNWDFSRGFAGGRCSRRYRVAADAVRVPHALGASPDGAPGCGSGRWCHRCHPSAPPSIPPRRITGSSSAGGGKPAPFNSFFFFFQGKSQKNPPQSTGFWCVS